MKENVKKLVGKMLESKGKLRIFKKEDEMPDGQYFVQIPAADAKDLDVQVIDGDICVGPFDTVDQAQAAAGDLPVVDDEGTPVMTAENPATAESRKKHEAALKAQVDKMISEAEATELNIDTDAGGQDQSTTDGAGNVATGVSDTANPPVDNADAPINDETDNLADKSQSGGDGTADVPTPDADGGLQGAPGTTDITESWESYVGTYVLVKEKTGAAGQIDSGMVTKADSKGVEVNGTKYERNQYTIIKIA